MMAAPAVFDVMADTYDAVFTESPIGRAQRQVVWRELERLLVPGQRVLEINCGTGADAVFMAERGVSVDACDASPRMIDVARRNSTQVNFFVQAIEDLRQQRGLYDGVLSNFGGLNCVGDLRSVAGELARLVRPGGFFVLCLAGRFCPWELLWYAAHADLSTACRRFRGEADAHVSSRTVRVYYRTVADLRRAFAPWFRILRRRGVGVLVPPTYMAASVAKHPRLFATAVAFDRCLSRLPLARALADHVLLVMQRTSA